MRSKLPVFASITHWRNVPAPLSLSSMKLHTCADAWEMENKMPVPASSANADTATAECVRLSLPPLIDETLRLVCSPTKLITSSPPVRQSSCRSHPLQDEPS